MGEYPVSQRYGERPAYYAQFGLAGHEGLDFATPIGVNLLCPFEEGVILRDNDDPRSGAYGNYIVIWDKSQKCAVWYCHESMNNVSVGQTFKRGQVMGKTGNSGNSSGPHLHFNIVETDERGNRLNMNNGYQGFLDPEKYIEWITNSPQLPMTTDRRPYWFDRMNTVTFNKPQESVTDADVEQFVKDYPGQKKRSGEFDKLARELGFSGDTNTMTANMLLKVAEEKYKSYDEQKIRKDERQKTIAQIQRTIEQLNG